MHNRTCLVSSLPFVAGGLQDADTGSVRFGVRDYDPDLGRFISPDPAWQAGTSDTMAEKQAREKAVTRQQVVDPAPYGYCLDDPVNMSDPTGMMGNKVQEAPHGNAPGLMDELQDDLDRYNNSPDGSVEQEQAAYDYRADTEQLWDRFAPDAVATRAEIAGQAASDAAVDAIMDGAGMTGKLAGEIIKFGQSLYDGALGSEETSPANDTPDD